MLRALIHSSEIITGQGIKKKDGRRIIEDDLTPIPNGALVYSARKVRGMEVPTKIEWLGPTKELPKRFLRIPRKDLKEKHAIIPGLVDCHTHLVFAGDRSEEFAERCGGATYEEIAARGGGIVSTVNATRAATLMELERLAIPRLKEAASFGVKTIEVKSGYGLTFDSEIKILEVIPRLRNKFPNLRITATYLGAHAFPKEVKREDYLKQILEKHLPEIAKRKLADCCDVFVDKGYFTIEESRKILDRAKHFGLSVKLHADELENTESASLAAEMNALSADHLLQISDDSIERIAQSQTVAVLLPGTAFYLKAAHAPARKLINAGASVALATDFNPGTCMTLSLPTIMTIAALYLGMSKAEIFAAVTYNAAKALGLGDSIGTLQTGGTASFSVLPFPTFQEMYYRFAWSPEFLVPKNIKKL